MEATGSMDATDVLGVRSPSSFLCELIDNLSDGQKNVIKNIGFQSVLELKIKDIPKDLGSYVLSKLDTTKTSIVIETPSGDIPVNEESVHEVYGFPMGPTILNRSRQANYNKVPMIIELKTHLGLDNDKDIYPPQLLQKMKLRKASDYLFKLDFLVMMVSTLVESMSNGRAYIRFLASITKNSDFKEFNWCDFVVKAVKDCKEKWDHSKKSSKFVGPLAFLVLLFCDRVATKIARVPPVITRWKPEDLIELDGKKDFGSYKLLPAWSETASGKAYLLLALNLEKDIHFKGCGCPKVEGDDVDKDPHEQTEEETVETVVKEVDGLIENLAIARDHTKRRLDEAVNRFGANEKIQSIMEKWNLTFSNQPIIINDDTTDLGYPSSRDHQDWTQVSDSDIDQLALWTQVSYSDIDQLAPKKCLNDEIMNFYLGYLQKNASPTNGAISDYYFFNTFFYVKLKEALSPKAPAENLFKHLRRWWNNFFFFQKEYIIIPINESSHWSLVILCMRGKVDKSGPIILHLDSFGMHDTSKIVENIKRFMEEEVKIASLKSTGQEVKVPQQENPYDCGVYVLMYIEHFIKHAPNRMKTEYLTIFGEKCFGIKEVCALRRRIQSFIKEFLKRVPGNDSIPRNKQNLEDKVDKISRKRNMDTNRETNEESSKNVEPSNKISKKTKVKFKDVKEVDDVKLRRSIRVKKKSYKLLT